MLTKSTPFLNKHRIC